MSIENLKYLNNLKTQQLESFQSLVFVKKLRMEKAPSAVISRVRFSGLRLRKTGYSLLTAAMVYLYLFNTHGADMQIRLQDRLSLGYQAVIVLTRAGVELLPEIGIFHQAVDEYPVV